MAIKKLALGFTIFVAGVVQAQQIVVPGGHGFGMSKRGLPVDRWIDQFGEWLIVQGFAKR